MDMFGRQWFAPGSQLALEDEALDFENLLRKGGTSKAIEMADNKLYMLSESNVRDYWLRQRVRANRLSHRNIKSSVVTVAFTGFWAGFKENDNEILNILRKAASYVGIEVKTCVEDPDLLLYSCFGEPFFSKYPGATRILYLGENVRPDFGYADYSLTFDISDYCGKNIYLPLWLLRTAEYAIKTDEYQACMPDELEQVRISNNEKNSVIYIGNNSTATRIQAIRSLRTQGVSVDCFGSQTKPVANKIKTLEMYRYSLCFENTYTPGYVTEKIIDSFIGKSRPIYWGGAPREVFNLDEHFSCNPYKTMDLNIKDFLEWKRFNTSNTIPPLLIKGGFKKTETSILVKLARIFLDLF
ncbi:glycosyltransferase family 10 domain-containing protein [Synechococcus sp. UW179B]|uniref:glycosyltransferase family 10 domain-containing protein n=1 Tax=Synechococcus sp. UW179B TaxID=2575516 RepID=UPI000E0FDD26|nr:glycosyltransferase family 10 [Synechococcus sp. UW179B]